MEVYQALLLQQGAVKDGATRRAQEHPKTAEWGPTTRACSNRERQSHRFSILLRSGGVREGEGKRTRLIVEWSQVDPARGRGKRRGRLS